MMQSTLRLLGLAFLLVTLAASLLATNSPTATASVDTNFFDPQIFEENPQVEQLKEALEKEGINTTSLLDEHFLFASLLWGSVGVGYLIYGRRQREIAPFIGGVALIGISYLVASWFWMSVLCLVLMVAVYQLMRQGH